MIASSTRRPRERMRAPSVMRSNSFPAINMMTSVAESVIGTAAATTMPTRQPRLTRPTIEDYILIFVIQDRRQNSLRQPRRFILDLLAPLIELSLNSTRRCVVLENDGKEGEARPRIAIHMVVIREL